MKQKKPRYPAKWFHRLKRFPKKRCEYEACREWLVPVVRRTRGGGEVLETPREFEARRFCNRRCSALHRKLGRHARPKSGKESSAPAQALTEEDLDCTARNGQVGLSGEIREALVQVMRYHDLGPGCSLLEFMGYDNPANLG